MRWLSQIRPTSHASGDTGAQATHSVAHADPLAGHGDGAD
jgi:hypothetical protein